MIARLLLFLIIALAIPGLRAQEMDVDSLRSELHHARNDTSYARAAYYLARNLYYAGELDSVRAYAQRGIARFPERRERSQRDLFWLTQLHRIKGMGWYSTSRFDSAIVTFQAMYRYAEQAHIPKDMGAALSYQGFALRETDDQQGALTLVRKAVGVLQTLPVGPDIANAYHELGVIHANLGNTDSALFWYGRSIDLYREQGNEHHLLNAMINVGEALHRAQRWAAADSVQRSTHALLPVLTDPMAYDRWVAGEARLLLRTGEHARAIHLLDSAITMATGMDDHNARHHLLKLRALAQVQAGALDKAFADDDASMQARDTDLDLEKVRATEKARGQFEHELALALQAADLRSERLQKWGAVALCVLALALAFVWFRSYRAKSAAARTLLQKNVEIQRAQDELVRSEKQREAEQVRTRIARDIHDDIGATLTKIALLSGVALQKGQDPAEAAKTFARISEHTKNVSRALSDVVWAVDPQRDTHQGMLDHVRDLAQRLLGDNGIRFELDLHAHTPDGTVTPGLKRDLHLVLNECCNNILKYAHAKLVRVKLHLHATTFELRVDDDGLGFDPASVPDRGNGLKNMPARMARHGATLTIASAPGKGTVLQAHGPLA